MKKIEIDYDENSDNMSVGLFYEIRIANLKINEIVDWINKQEVEDGSL